MTRRFTPGFAVLISFILIIPVILVIPAYAQIPVIQWDKTAGGTAADQCMDIIQTRDGGYVASGRSTSGANGDKTEAARGGIDYWLIKLNPAGTAIQWQKTLGTSSDDMPSGVIETPDGGYMISGQSNGGANGDRTVASFGARDYWVLKLDQTGIPLWQNAYGGNSNDMGYCMAPAANGGFVIGGASMSGVSGTRSEINRGDYDYWILKMDSSRNLQWNKAIGGSGWEQQNVVLQTHDGGYMLGGASRSPVSSDKADAFIGGQYDYWVVKLDSFRNIQWQKTLGGTADDYLSSVQQTSDLGYILAGHSNSGISGNKTEASKGGFDYWVIKLDAQGNIQWQKTIGGTGDETIYSMHAAKQTSDGGYVIAGTSGSGISGDKTEPSKGGKDYWLVKLNGTGVIQWQKTVGGSADDELRAFQLTSDGGYILGGMAKSGISGDKTETNRGGDDFWIVKLLYPCDTAKIYQTDSFCAGADYLLPGGGITPAPGVYSDTFKTPLGCDSIIVTTLIHKQDDIQLQVRNILGPDTAICEGIPYPLNAVCPGATGYLWNNSSTASGITATQSGSYFVAVTSVNGCIAYDTVSILFIPPPVLHLGNDTGICDRDLPMVLHAPRSPGMRYLWSNGLSDTVMEVVRSGSYWLEIQVNGCIVSDTINIRVTPVPQVSIGPDSIICEQVPVIIGMSLAGAAYRWNTGDTTAYIRASVTGRYILELNSYGCIVSDTVNITAMHDPDLDLGPGRDICPLQTILLNAASSGGNRYLWNTGDTTPVCIATTAGKYWVSVTSEYHCVSRDTIMLSPYPLPLAVLGEDTTVCLETPLTLIPSREHADRLQWSDGSSENTLKVNHGGQYTVTAFNKCGTVSDTIMLKEIYCDIWLPDAFTPNGDGRNDIFRASGNLNRISAFGLSIYNRWGERIFHTGNQYQGWDGRMKGSDAGTGTYFYKLDYRMEGGPQELKGSFHLIR